MKTDVVTILEACYRQSGSVDLWMDAVHAALRPALGSAEGLICAADDGDAATPTWVRSDCAPAVLKLASTLSLLPGQEPARRTLPPPSSRPGGRLHSVREEVLASDPNGHELGLELCLSGLDDLLALGFSDPTRCWFGCFIPRALPRSPLPECTEIEKIGVHLLAGLRLASRPPPPPSAWFLPNGKVLQASEDALRERDVLTLAVQAIERARTRACRSEAPLALELWCGLVEGRWSLVEVTETDGRRLILAVENDPKVVPMMGLSARETQIAVLLAMGYSEKLAAYGLGLSCPTVSAHVGSACRTLGLTSRIELTRVVRALIGMAETELD